MSKQEYLAGLAKSLANFQRHEIESDHFVSRIIGSGARLRSDGDVGALDLGAIYVACREAAGKAVSARDRDILADFTPYGGTRTAVGYQTELQAVKEAVRRQRLFLVAEGVLLQLDNAKHHTAHTATALLGAGLKPCAPLTTEPLLRSQFDS